GKNPKILKSGFMTQEFYKNLWDKISSGNEFFGEILNRKKNGELFWELSRISCVKNEDNVITHYLAVKEDITQSKKMSEILTRSETFFRTVWENSMDAMRIISDTGLIVRVNDAFCRMFKKTREELEGHIFTVIHDSARQEDVDIVLGKMAARNIEPRQEMNLVLWNGEVLCVEISNSFLEIEGQPGMLLSIFSNITDRKDMEDKLTESESRFRSLIELSPDAVAIHSEGKVVYVNQAAVRIFGFDSYEELIGQPSFNYVHPDSHQAVRERISLMLREGGDVPFIEEKFLNKSGQAIDVEVASVPTVYRGKPAFQVIVRDIRERKKSEAALRLSEERFRTVFENSPLGICAIFESEIIMVNTACMKMFGYSAASELNGKTFLDFIAPTERDLREQSRIGRLNGEVTPTSFDGYGFKQDGTIFPYHAELSFLGLPEGEAIVAFLTDITEIKQKRDQIKTSLKEKETLLKEIHHRVKNNLQIISSLLSLQSEYVSDPQALELFNDSRNRVKSMAIIHERLYQSKDLSRIDFSDYINELGSYLFRTYTAAAIRFNISVDNIFLSIDTAIPCGLIINELISNALKYAFPERTDGTIKVIFRQQSGLNILEVSDNGVGFPPAIDFRNTNSLGLQLVNNLTEQLNGTIELKAHSGTTFVITFPEGEK
ncbi:MAG: PAS domain S-box protein, partial [Methanococcaceae archaeon]